MPTTRKPDVIVREIEQTRAELSDTIDAITEKMNPIPAVKAAAGKRSTLIAAGGAVLLVGLIVIRKRR